jgi:exodeoxyribonuclease VII small subunit
MPRSRPPAPAPPEKLSFEQAIEELEAIIEAIEQGRTGLEESLAQRKRGEALIRHCRTILDAAEQELQQVSPSPGAPPGTTGTAADDPSAAATGDDSGD